MRGAATMEKSIFCIFRRDRRPPDRPTAGPQRPPAARLSGHTAALPSHTELICNDMGTYPIAHNIFLTKRRHLA